MEEVANRFIVGKLFKIVFSVCFIVLILLNVIPDLKIVIECVKNKQYEKIFVGINYMFVMFSILELLSCLMILFNYKKLNKQYNNINSTNMLFILSIFMGSFIDLIYDVIGGGLEFDFKIVVSAVSLITLVVIAGITKRKKDNYFMLSILELIGSVVLLLFMLVNSSIMKDALSKDFTLYLFMALYGICIVDAIIGILYFKKNNSVEEI
ncbi:MAG: hypothetical protein ACI35W_03270 [Anaeroplasmataceae bacterium]